MRIHYEIFTQRNVYVRFINTVIERHFCAECNQKISGVETRTEHLDKKLHAEGASLLHNMACHVTGRNSAQYLGAVPTSVQ